MLFGSIQSFAHIYFYINNMSFVNWRYHASTARNIVCYTLRLQKCVECDNYHKIKRNYTNVIKEAVDACRGSFSDLFFPRADCLVIEYDVEAKRFREFHFTISPAASDHFATLVSKSKTVLFIRVQEGKAFGKTIAVKFNRPVFNSNLL